MLDLKQLVDKEAPLEVRRAVGYIASIGRQLDSLHSTGAIYRGLRPEEIQIAESDCASLSTRRFDYTNVAVDFTAAESVADYLAPEQAVRGHAVDRLSDIYSLGCVFFFALVGHAPFASGSVSERLLKHQVAKVPRITEERPEVPVKLADLCERMLAKSPAHRPQTAEEVSSILESWLNDNQ